MTLFLTGLLYISILGMSGIIWTKRWEERTGRILFASVRPTITGYVHSAALFVLYTLPRSMRRAVTTGYRYGRAVLRHALARSILWLEEALERLLHTIRHTAAHAEPSPLASSQFLREVAEYKNSLMHRSNARQIARMVEE